MSKFEELLSLNVNEKTETRKSGGTELTYLSWAWAWAEFKKKYPEATYEIKKFKTYADDEKGMRLVPYMYDEKTGYMVMTSVTADGITHEMWLPVMDSNNNAMKDKPYDYTTKYGTKTVEAADMFDINKAIMRCLVKNLAMFGLGLYIYAGEDLPEPSDKVKEPKKEKATAQQIAKVFEAKKIESPLELNVMINNCKSEAELEAIYKTNSSVICATPGLLDKITQKGKELRGAA